MEPTKTTPEEELDNQVPEAEAEETPEVPDSQEDQDEQEEPETPAEDEGQAEEPPAEDRQPSRRESLRIQQLIQKMKQTPETPQAPEAPTGLDYKTALDADPEVISQLEADRQQYGDRQRQEAFEQVKSIQFHTRLEIDAPKVESKFPVLDKNSDQFKPAVANALNSMYLSAVGYNPDTDTVQNPNLRYADYIDGIMELADEVASEKTVKAAKNVAKQAAATGLRPDGSRAKKLNLNQAPESMTDEELAAVIAQAIPKK